MGKVRRVELMSSTTSQVIWLSIPDVVVPLYQIFTYSVIIT